MTLCTRSGFCRSACRLSCPEILSFVLLELVLMTVRLLLLPRDSGPLRTLSEPVVREKLLASLSVPSRSLAFGASERPRETASTRQLKLLNDMRLWKRAMRAKPSREIVSVSSPVATSVSRMASSNISRMRSSSRLWLLLVVQKLSKSVNDMRPLASARPLNVLRKCSSTRGA